jgi:hypothetical protein
MSAYTVFTRTKTIDPKELETYWAGIRATMKGHPIEVLVAYAKEIRDCFAKVRRPRQTNLPDRDLADP